jgi:hypothetical protein
MLRLGIPACDFSADLPEDMVNKPSELIVPGARLDDPKLCFPLATKAPVQVQVPPIMQLNLFYSVGCMIRIRILFSFLC